MNAQPNSIEDWSTAADFFAPKDHWTDPSHKFYFDHETTQNSVGQTRIHETGCSNHAQSHPHVQYVHDYQSASKSTTVQETFLATCTIRSGPEGRECGSRLSPNYTSLAAHLRTVHDIQEVKLARTRLAGRPLITCPEKACRCRFRGRACAIQSTEATHHRTHVVDLVRHCMDKHLRMPRQTCIRCAHCGQSFTRRESLRRHMKRGCPIVRTAHFALCTN
jgi:hypothetical protein